MVTLTEVFTAHRACAIWRYRCHEVAIGIAHAYRGCQQYCICFCITRSTCQHVISCIPGYGSIVAGSCLRGLAQVALLVSSHITTSASFSRLSLYVGLLLPTGLPFFFHWYIGVGPPLAGVAVKVTNCPVHIFRLGLPAMLTEGTSTGFYSHGVSIAGCRQRVGTGGTAGEDTGNDVAVAKPVIGVGILVSTNRVGTIIPLIGWRWAAIRCGSCKGDGCAGAYRSVRIGNNADRGH